MNRSYWRDPFPLNHDCGRKSFWRWKKASATHLFYNSICNDRRGPTLSDLSSLNFNGYRNSVQFQNRFFLGIKKNSLPNNITRTQSSIIQLPGQNPRIIWKTIEYRHWVIAVEEHIPSRASLYLPSGKPEQKVEFPTPDTQCMLNVWCIYLHLGSLGGKRRHINLPYIDIKHLGTASFDLGTCFFLKKTSHFPSGLDLWMHHDGSNPRNKSKIIISRHCFFWRGRSWRPIKTTLDFI